VTCDFNYQDFFMKNIKFILVATILAVVCFVGISSYLPERFDAGTSVQMAAFPKTVGPWTGEDIALTPRDYAILETKNLIMRKYTRSSGEAVVLYIVYSEDNRKVSHPPEVCYSGGGSTIAQKGTFSVSPRIPANKMIAEYADGTRQFVVYWYKAGDFQTAKYLDQQFRIVWRRTFGKKTSAALIRVSADVKEGEEARVGQMIREFSSAIEPLLQKYVP
jgi:EpsI family protein